MAKLTEQLVEDVPSVYFSAIDVSIKRGVESERFHHKQMHPMHRLDMLRTLSKITQYDE